MPIDPRALQASIGPEGAVGALQDSSAEILGVINTAVTKQGDAGVITLDLEEVDAEFANDAMSVQKIVTNSKFQIKQKIYMQTEASRLLEIGSLSSRIFQVKYAKQNNISLDLLRQGKISVAEFMDAQRLMLSGGENSLGIFNEPLGPDNPITVGEKIAPLEEREAQYLETVSDLATQLQEGTLSKNIFLKLQLEAMDTLLDSNPIQSPDAYLSDYKSLIDQLLDLNSDEAYSRNLETVNTYAAGSSWNDTKSAMEDMVAQLLESIGGSSPESIASKIGAFEFKSLNTDYDFKQIDDGDNSYGIDTDLAKAPRLYDGKLFKTDEDSSSIEKVLNYVYDQSNLPEATPEEQLRLQLIYSLPATVVDNINQIPLQVPEGEDIQKGFYALGKVELRLTDLKDDINKGFLTRVPPGDARHYYSETNSVASLKINAPRSDSSSVRQDPGEFFTIIEYQGVSLEIDKDLWNSIQSNSLTDNELAYLGKQILKAAVLETNFQSQIATVFHDKRTAFDVINGDRRLADKSYDQMTDLEKLFAGIGAKARGVAEIVEEEFNSLPEGYVFLHKTEDEVPPRTQDIRGYLPLLDADGYPVSEIDYLDTSGKPKINADGLLLDKNNQVIPRMRNGVALYAIESGKLIRTEDDRGPLPLINSSGHVVEPEELKRNSEGNLIYPLQDKQGSKIRLFNAKGIPVFQVKPNPDKVKQQMVNLNGEKIVTTSVEINSMGKIQAPDFAEHYWDLESAPEGKAYVESGATKVLIDQSTREIQEIYKDGVKIDFKVGALLRLPNNDQLLFDLFPDSRKLSPPEDATKELLTINAGDYAPATTRETIVLGEDGLRAVLDETGSYIESFVRIDKNSQQTIYQPNIINLALDEDSKPISLLDGEMLLAKLDMKRVNQAASVYALEELTASKLNTQRDSGKLPEPRKDGSLPVKPLAPPELRPTASAMILAAMGQKIVQQAKNLKYLEIDTARLSRSSKAVTNFNSKLTEINSGFKNVLNTALQETLEAIANPEGPIALAKQDYEQALKAAEDAASKSSDPDKDPQVIAARLEAIAAMKTFAEAMRSLVDSDTKADALENQAKAWLERESPDSVASMLASVHNNMQGFSKDINVFNTSIDKIFGPKSSGGNMDSKAMRELFTLTFVFAISEQGEWDSANSDFNMEPLSLEES